jgi:hypothetical protein
MTEKIDLFLKATLFADALYETESPVDKGAPFDTGESSIATPITQFLSKAARGLLAKSAGVADANWDEPLAKTVELSPEFIERSNQRFEKMSAAIDKVFANHPAERKEAIEVAKRALADARNDALMAA